MRITPDRVIPALQWGRQYDRGKLVSDLLAAVIATVMLIPQSLAYAMLAGLPPEVGLYASILPPVGYALFGSSRVLAVGPVAVVSLLTLAALEGLAPPGSPEFVAAAIALAALSGLMLAAVGLCRLGFLANLLSHPVISGFITASAVLIAVSQLKHVAGVEAQGDSLLQMLRSLTAQLRAFNAPTVIIGLVAIAFLLWARTSLQPLLARAGLSNRLSEMLSRASVMISVIVSTVVVSMLGLHQFGVNVVGEVPRGLPPLALPTFDPELWLALIPAAGLVSIVGFVESVSVARTLAARRRQRIGEDQELIGLGVANLAAAVGGGYPVSGSFSRSAINLDAGAVTPMAGVFTGAGILATALFFTPLFHNLPQAVLAATVIVAVLSLVDIKELKRTFIYSKGDFAAAAVTILVVLGVGVEAGIVAGVLLSIVLFVWRTSRPHMAIVGEVPGTEHFRNILRHKVVTSETVLSVRVDESLYFVNARYLEDRIQALVAGRPALQHLVLMCSAINFIDASGLETLKTIAGRLDSAGIEFHLSEVKGPVMDNLKRSDFFEHLTGEVFLSQHAAIEKLDPAATRLTDASLLSGGADGVRPNGVAAGAASRAAGQAIQPVIIQPVIIKLNSNPAADKARTSAKDNGVGDYDGPFMNHGSDI
jgi:sulfate permease, SulP family